MTENFRGRKGIIIGGGASGLMAAITAAEQGAAVTVIEHTARPGKKILSTGNGKCNLTNLYMDPSFYRSDEKGFWGTAIRNFPPKAAVAFFRNLGVLTMDRGGYVYPMSGQAQTVLDELPTEAEAVSSANKNYGEAQLVSVASDSGAKFFEQARLKRQKAHDEAMDSIKKTMKSSSLSAEEKKEYTAQMTANLEDLNAENEIETLIKAKGFADCLCFLQSGRADLTVMTSGEPLTAAQVAQIRDVVLNKSTVTAQNITVVEVK